jgi:toxin FitB
MIVLDTNVLSESLRPAPAESVLRWLAGQDPLAIFTTAITQAELLYGVELLPAGKRRSRLSSAIEKMFADEFPRRILAFDEEAARAFPKLTARRGALGRPISQFDAMIASICLSHGAVLATRNVRDFEHCGLPLIDPWDE